MNEKGPSKVGVGPALEYLTKPGEIMIIKRENGRAYVGWQLGCNQPALSGNSALPNLLLRFFWDHRLSA